MDDDDQLRAELDAIGAGIIGAQMYAMPAFFILRELVADVARLHPDPRQYLSDLFERVTAKVDSPDPSKEQQVLEQARHVLGTLFRDAQARTTGSQN